jgi:acyl carrier protein
MDAGMDSAGVEAGLAVLKKMSRERNKNVYQISHKDELVGRVNHVLRVIKENGFTSFANDLGAESLDLVEFVMALEEDFNVEFPMLDLGKFLSILKLKPFKESDLEFDDNVKNALENFQGNIVYPRRDPNHPETLWETTLHLMSFDKDLMKKIEKEITLDEYLSTNGVAEGEVLKWKNKFNIYGSENPVKDKIFYWKDYDFFDYSPVKDFKMFISKNEPMDIWLGEGESVHKELLTDNLRIVFYGSEYIGEVILKVDDVLFNIEPKPFKFLEFPINSKGIKEIKIIYNGVEYDLSNEYSKIMLNQIYHNCR